MEKSLRTMVNLLALHVYWCQSPTKTENLFNSLHYFPNLSYLFIDDMEYLPEQISPKCKPTLQRLESLYISKIRLENMSSLLSKVQFSHLNVLIIELTKLILFTSLGNSIELSDIHSLDKLTILNIKCQKLPENISH